MRRFLAFRGKNVRVTRRRWTIAAVAALLAVNASLWLASFGLALPRPLASYLFGAGLVRAEVVYRSPDGVLHDYRIDKGRVRAIARTSLTLRERDGTVVTIAVAPTAQVLVNGRQATLAQVRRGMMATTVRDGDRAAEDVRANAR